MRLDNNGAAPRGNTALREQCTTCLGSLDKHKQREDTDDELTGNSSLGSKCFYNPAPRITEEKCV